MIGIIHEFEWPVASASLMDCDRQDHGQSPMEPDRESVAGRTAPDDETVPEMVPAPNAGIINLLQSIHHSLESIDRSREDQIQRWQLEAIELGMTIARAVIGLSVHASTDRIGHVIHSARSSLFDLNQPLTVRVHPEDHDRLTGLELDGSPLDAQVSLRADEAIPRGECEISSQELTVASDLGLQLEEIHRRLVEELNHD